MKENLVIVESPAKAKTIEKFLGKDYIVMSSFGHIRDLAKKNLGIDIENNFSPNYVIPTEKKKVVSDLKKMATKLKTIWLASDEDREGEAIAWHLSEVLNLNSQNTKRIVFHEITKNAIQKAIQNPRKIDTNLVNAQQARRILDRIVGFEISPILWKKVKPALSAGRVQSVAVRLVVERDREIGDFKTNSFYKVVALFTVTDAFGKETIMKAELQKKIKDKKEALDFLEKNKNSEYKIKDIEKKPSRKSPSPPFTTSTLQQEAGRKLGFSVSQTMTIAQKLYEAGKITYMRTDSVSLSDFAVNAIKKVVIEEYGNKYLKTRVYKTKAKGAQEAHEAIRPSTIERKVSNNYNEQRLYDLILKRSLASQMSDAIIEKTIVTISSNKHNEMFISTGEILKFDGFLKAYKEGTDDENTNTSKQLLPPLEKNQILKLNEINARERFTHHPPRYTEASLVKKMEELGIGRPSTYAPTISTIQKRGYVIKETREGLERKYVLFRLKNEKITEEQKSETTGNEKSKLFPTDIAMVVNDFLVQNFTNILDYNFTASVEKDFDKIASGNIVWTNMIGSFYKPFHSKVEQTLEQAGKESGERILGIDPKTEKQVSVRIGRFGPMVQLGISNLDDKTIEKPKFASLNKEQRLESITLEEALDLLENSNSGRKLGIDPESGKQIIARAGRYGPMVQLGEKVGDEKPKYAALMKGQTLENISLKEAIVLFKLPRTIGEYENKVVVAAIGRFGPYVRHDSKFVSLKKTDNPYTVQLDRAIVLIEEKRETERKRLIKTFDEDEELKIINDRWGRPCIFYNKKYYTIAKETEPVKLSYDDCLKIISLDPKSETSKKKKTTTKTKKAATAKKTTGRRKSATTKRKTTTRRKTSTAKKKT